MIYSRSVRLRDPVCPKGVSYTNIVRGLGGWPPVTRDNDVRRKAKMEVPEIWNSEGTPLDWMNAACK